MNEDFDEYWEEFVEHYDDWGIEWLSMDLYKAWGEEPDEEGDV